MGEWKKARSIKFGTEREQKMFEIADRFSPFMRNPLTDVACFAVDWLWVCIQRGMMERIMGAIQELRCNTECDIPTHAAPGVGAAAGSAGQVGPRRRALEVKPR